jgi:hypothetical protein
MRPESILKINALLHFGVMAFGGGSLEVHFQGSSGIEHSGSDTFKRSTFLSAKSQGACSHPWMAKALKILGSCSPAKF